MIVFFQKSFYNDRKRWGVGAGGLRHFRGAVDPRLFSNLVLAMTAKVVPDIMPFLSRGGRENDGVFSEGFDG